MPARDVWSAIVQTANNLESSAVISGLSSKMTAQEQAFELGRAWEAAPEPKRQFVVQIVHPDQQVDTCLDKLHHHDVVTEALTRFARDYAGRDRQDILRELRKTTGKTVATRAIGGDGNKPPARQDDDVARKKDDGPPSPPVVRHLLSRVGGQTAQTKTAPRTSVAVARRLTNKK